MAWPDPQLNEQLKNNGADFLSVDIDTALTFTQIAADSERDSETRRRNHENARKAYDTILHLKEKVDFRPEQRTDLEKKLATLKHALERLGEAL